MSRGDIADIQFDKEFSASFGIAHLIKGAFSSLTSKEDLAKIKAFFDARGVFGSLQRVPDVTDISRYKLSVHQVYDTIQAASDWLERDQQDVKEVSTRWAEVASVTLSAASAPSVF